jgi:hypothetical protein
MHYTVDRCIGPVTKTNARAQSVCELFQGLLYMRKISMPHSEL